MKLMEIYRHKQGTPRYNPTAEIPLVLQHPDFTGNEEDLFAEPQVEVEFTMSAGDPAVGWKGGADEVVGVTAAEEFNFMGKRYQVGQEIPDELLQYWDKSRGYNDVYDYLLSAAEENAGEGAMDADDDGDYAFDRMRDERAEREWESGRGR